MGLFWLAATSPALADSSQATTEAQVPLKHLSLEQLGNVEVTSVSKEPEEVWNTPAAIYVLTQDDIGRSGATTIPEVLRLVPGVEVARVTSNGWSVGIRGFGNIFSKSVLVLIDGRSVYTPLFEGVYWDMQNVMLEDVDRIEVIRGPGGTIWGSNAVNGVINIITKNAKDTHGALASVGGGNVDQGMGMFRYGGSVRQNFNYRVYGMGFTRGPEFHPDANEFDGWRMGQVGFRTDWTHGRRDSFMVEGDVYRGEIGQLNNIAFYAPPSQANIDNEALVSGGSLVWTWRRQLRRDSDFHVEAYFDRTNRQDLQFGETRDTFDIDFVDHFKLPGSQDFIWGVGVRESPSYFIQTQETVNFLPHRQTDSIYSGFIQDEFPIVPNRISVTLGSKLEDNNFSGFEYQPSVRLLWTPSDHQTLWAAVSRAVRTPSRFDQDLQVLDLVSPTPPYPVFLRIAGDPNFAAERLFGYEAGYRTLITPRFYLDLDTFFNNYNDVESLGTPSISLQAEPPPADPINIVLTYPWANGLVGNTDGIEISPDWKPTSWWQLKGSYSYLEMHLRDKAGITDSSTAAKDVGSSPHHEVVVQSLFNLPGRFEFDPTYRYVSALPAQSVSSYSTMDLHAGWTYRKQFTISVVGEDLFSPDHFEFGLGVSGAPNVGIKRSVYASITWKR
ncbi:MAG: TonB-dependent receptor plug domain-containing protein [Candidatus Acidiferrales bacterium]